MRYFFPLLNLKRDISAFLPTKLYKEVKPTALHSGTDN